MNKQSLIVGAVIVGGALAALTATGVQAYQGTPTVNGPRYTPERHAEMVKVIEAGDYAAWKKLVPAESRVSEVVTAQNFPQFARAHALTMQGKTAEAQKIRQELGLGKKDGEGRASKMRMGEGCTRSK